MLAPHASPMAAADFLEWMVARDDRYDLVRGLPLRMMAGATQSHNVVVGNMADAMRFGANACGRRTTSSDTAVITGSAGRTAAVPDDKTRLV
ncbi:MAG: hypothetical protein H7Y08_04925 [Rhizobiaceae bacterium]|nr:hypothetical protein [Rhizobiaceae bacterium]